MACYKDEEWLVENYVETNKGTIEVADMAGVSRETIRTWLHKHDLPVRASGREHDSKEYADKELLEELYWGERESLTEIASRFDCDQRTIGRWMDRFGIPKRNPESTITFSFNSCGYYTVNDPDEPNRRALLHRLVAVAEHGYDAVVDNVVHHKNGIKWDNRPDNLELMSLSDHTKHHHLEHDLS